MAVILLAHAVQCGFRDLDLKQFAAAMSETDAAIEIEIGSQTINVDWMGIDRRLFLL